MMIKLIELFGGIGTQAMAMRDSGIPFEAHRLIENDPSTVAVYNAIHNTDFVPTDIREVKGNDLEILDDGCQYWMTYSYPCTSLSSIGKKDGMVKGSGTASSLLWEVERLLNECDILPNVLIMENVTQCHSKRNRADFDMWCDFLSAKGYTNTSVDIDSYNYGVPQHRIRCFMVSIQNHTGCFVIPYISKCGARYFDFIEPHYPEKYIITQPTVIKTIQHIIKQNECSIQYAQIGRVSVMKNVVDIYNKRPKKDYTVPTITAHSNSSVSRCGTAGIIVDKLGKIEVRRLMPLECWRIMGYSDREYYIAKSVKDNDAFLYKLAGNGIVKPILTNIFKKLYRVTGGEKVHIDSHFRTIQTISTSGMEIVLGERSSGSSQFATWRHYNGRYEIQGYYTSSDPIRNRIAAERSLFRCAADSSVPPAAAKVLEKAATELTTLLDNYDIHSAYRKHDTNACTEYINRLSEITNGVFEDTKNTPLFLFLDECKPAPQTEEEDELEL